MYNSSNFLIESESKNKTLQEQLKSLESNHSKHVKQVAELENTCSSYKNEIEQKKQALIGVY